MSERPGSGEESDHPNDPAIAEMIVPEPRAAARARWAMSILVLLVAVYAVLAMLAHRYAYFGWDLSLARGIQALSNPVVDAVMTAVSQLGNGWIPFGLVIVAGLTLL